MRRWNFIASAIMLAAFVFAVCSIVSLDSCESDADSSTFYDKLTNANYVVLSDVENTVGVVSSTSTSLSFPETITHNDVKYSITKICDGAFKDRTDIKDVKFSSKMNEIGKEAFKGCTSLRMISFYADMTIREDAFKESGVLNVSFNEDVDLIEKSAFESCTSLTRVKFSNTVGTLMDCVFKGCTRLYDVTVPETIDYVGSSLFEDCTLLNITHFPIVKDYIGESVFKNCTSITEMTLTAGIPELRDYVFYGCTSLKKITLTTDLVTIGTSVFDGCINLSEVNTYFGIITIGENAFLNCSKLESLKLPSSVESIDSHAFNGCNGLTYITIPQSVSYLGEQVFGTLKFYDTDGRTELKDKDLPGYSYSLMYNRMVRSDGCYYTISYDVTGGSVEMEDSLVNESQSIYISKYSGAKEGFSFAGWECEGQTYAVGTTFFMPGHSVKFTAVWEVYTPEPVTPEPEKKDTDSTDNVRFIFWAVISAMFLLSVALMAVVIISIRNR